MTIKKGERKKGHAGVSLLMLQSREIGAAEFKSRCLEVMDEVERLGVEVVITKHRRPVARLVPINGRKGGFCGSMTGMVLEWGDIVTSTGDVWDADESNLT